LGKDVVRWRRAEPEWVTAYVDNRREKAEMHLGKSQKRKEKEERGESRAREKKGIHKRELDPPRWNKGGNPFDRIKN